MRVRMALHDPAQLFLFAAPRTAKTRVDRGSRRDDRGKTRANGASGITATSAANWPSCRPGSAKLLFSLGPRGFLMRRQFGRAGAPAQRPPKSRPVKRNERLSSPKVIGAAARAAPLSFCSESDSYVRADQNCLPMTAPFESDVR